MAAHQLPIRLADASQGIQILLLVEDVPGEAHDVLRLAVRLLQDIEDVLQSLPELAGEAALPPFALAGPADLAGDEHELAARGDAVGKPSGTRPAGRLQDF